MYTDPHCGTAESMPKSPLNPQLLLLYQNILKYGVGRQKYTLITRLAAATGTFVCCSSQQIISIYLGTTLSSTYFNKYDAPINTIFKIIQKSNLTTVPKIILKNFARAFTIHDFKAYYKTIGSKTV